MLECVKNGLFILSGGPGTGKTTTINTIIRYFEAERLDILLAAPTGRAAKRMTEATGYEARTIHRMLELNGALSEEGKNHVRFERNEENPLEAGIEIIAQPPGKKLQNINLMSGGEKTMTAIALMFAVLKTKPTPFCILDEVEAALDDANIDRFADYLKKFHEIQFAIVTHQKATMEHADVLYGVTMPEQGISKVLSLRLGDKIDL